ncbi:hypothetical protein JGI1_02085 [Candidatus Thermokryptus mobilis]|uniref:Uncharacterized protein n=1 Tax=Candidatus Thermokryptus mobilis TaxID=1643428 RepID=A0A0S4NEB5_9BACT|nr:hypothetical protein [Candidatus Thermokryptus mobilis]CUU08431.1 hypothetical protein JGI1_02085 [Candidatus Thermokryptus mobilis]
MKKVIFPFLMLLFFALLYSQTKDDDPGKLSPIPTFYKGRWIEMGVRLVPRLCNWVEITFGFPSLIQIRTRYTFDRYISWECGFEGLECMLRAKRETIEHGRCD